MNCIEVYWTHQLGWVAEMAPHAMDAPAESVYTSVAAVADLVRQDPAERGRAIRMEPKNRRLLSLMPFMQGGRT
jgi:hypothetical protein